MAAGKCYQACAKSTLLLDLAAIRNDSSLPAAPLAGFTTMKGNRVWFSVFRSHNCRLESWKTKFGRVLRNDSTKNSRLACFEQYRYIFRASGTIKLPKKSSQT